MFGQVHTISLPRWSLCRRGTQWAFKRQESKNKISAKWRLSSSRQTNGETTKCGFLFSVNPHSFHWSSYLQIFVTNKRCGMKNQTKIKLWKVWRAGAAGAQGADRHPDQSAKPSQGKKKVGYKDRHKGWYTCSHRFIIKHKYRGLGRFGIMLIFRWSRNFAVNIVDPSRWSSRQEKIHIWHFEKTNQFSGEAVTELDKHQLGKAKG